MHPILVGAPRDMSGNHQPAILQRSDEDFIEATLDDLRTSKGRKSLLGLRAAAQNNQGVLKLFQPIQRQFHVALIEAWCDVPGTPRIDPAKVESAGMVLRRVGAAGQYEGWMRSKGRVRGWVPLGRVGGDSSDPGAETRLLTGLTGVADIDRQLTSFKTENSDSLLNEHVIPLYMAPPDVCADAVKTVFYGIVPTVSGELSEAEPVFCKPGDDSFGPDSAAFSQHLVEALRGGGQDFPFAGQSLVSGWYEASEMPGDNAPDGVSKEQWDELKKPDSTDSRRMARFLLLLRQLASEFNAFDGGKDVDALRKILQKIQLPLVVQGHEKQRRHVQAYDFLDKAVKVLLSKEAVGGSIEMPQSWPQINNTEVGKLAQALHAAMQARFKALKGKAGRFDEPDARYALRAFVRLKPDCDCPGRIVWSDYSEPFVIAAWYDGAGAPPVQIALPDPSDRKLLKELKPNVAFVLPASMQQLLSGKTKDLLAGKGSADAVGLSWICGFNIPTITICAFIVLNIFLTLLNLIFGWLFFIKICIPFPNFKKP
jgi:hypothetical protein